MHRYLQVLRDRSAAIANLANILSATGIGAYDLAVILYVRSATGSLGWAGIVGGALTVGNALGLSWQGQLIDRVGARLIIPAAGLGCAAAGWALTMAPADSPALLIMFALAGGLLLPAVTTAARPVVDIAQRRTGSVAGYALLSLTFQLGMTAGPLLVSVLLAALDAGWAVRASGLLLAAAGLLMILVGRPPRPAVAPTSGRARWTPELIRLLIIASLLGFGSGLTRIGATGYAAGIDRIADVGWLLSASAIGGIAGGLAYGGRSWPGTLVGQFRVSLLAAGGVGILLVATTALGNHWQPVAFVVVAILMLAAGTSNAPAGVISSVLIDHAVPADTRARGYAALVGCSLISSALGSSIGGPLADRIGPVSLFVIAAAAILLAAGRVRATAAPAAG